MSGELLINGAFHSSLWTRLLTESVECPVNAETFAADRWRVSYAAPLGSAISQARSTDAPPGIPADTSLELRGHEGVSQPVYLGQKIEAAEASAYGRELRLTAWCLAEHPTLTACPVQLKLSSPRAADLFDDSVETVWRSKPRTLPTGPWHLLEFTFDASNFPRHGLQMEFEFSPEFLADPAARIRLALVSLHAASAPAPPPRPAALEHFLARRYFQRLTAKKLNAIGRALVCNPHELHFQLTFPEMRSFPAITLPLDNDLLTVFSLEGVPQLGFVYDISYTSRGSAMVRATKSRHHLGDGYLAFRGYEAAILLDAEL